MTADERNRVRAQFNVSNDTSIIIQVSRISPLKGHLLHLDALAALRDVPHWQAWIVGGPQKPAETLYFADLKRKVEVLDLTDRVRFLGERSDVASLLGAADLYCQPNVGPEAFGITFVEAMAAGLPVITTKMGGALEIVNDDVGVLIAPDAAELADELRALVADPDRRRRLGIAGRARARQLADPAARVNDLAEAFKAALPRSNPAPTSQPVY